MKLLFDENLSHGLVDRLSDAYPGSQHVRQLGMKSSPDRIVLGYAGLMDMVLVTKDKAKDPGAVWSRLVQSTRRVTRDDFFRLTGRPSS